MCDYSLAGIPNRLAVEGEELVVHPFPTGALGLASSNTPLSRWWSAKATPAVCDRPVRAYFCETSPWASQPIDSFTEFFAPRRKNTSATWKCQLRGRAH
jgi:hypothetical protein